MCDTLRPEHPWLGFQREALVKVAEPEGVAPAG